VQLRALYVIQALFQLGREDFECFVSQRQLVLVLAQRP
jgi:hypothetical protein